MMEKHAIIKKKSYLFSIFTDTVLRCNNLTSDEKGGYKKMSQTSERVRREWKIGDAKRDAGLTTPEDIKRYDDILYGADPVWNLLDVYRPKKMDGKLPVIVNIHGGGWVYGNKELNEYYCMDFSSEEFEKIVNLLGSIESVYNLYYDTLIKAVNSDLGEYKPKRIGHLNLVRKYNKKFPYDYSKNKKLEELVKLISEKEYELDYNVAGLFKEDCGEVYISGYLAELIKKYNVKVVLGSDSHSSKFIDKYKINI